MKNKTLFKIMLILLPIILFVGIVYWFFDMFIVKADQPLEPEVMSSSFGAYEYNPETIIQNIHDGKTDVIKEVDYEFGINLPKENMTVTPFSEDEFYEISQYIFKNSVEGDIQEWKLVKIRYKFYDCNNEIVLVSYSYERQIFINDTKYIQNFGVGISTYSNVVTWSDKVEKRDWVNEGINVNDIIYNAYDVETISNNYGEDIFGQEFYNNCGYITIELYGKKPKWDVDYYDNGIGLDIINIEVDSRTGKRDE